ncbi:MAG: DUF4367 domain-containing protein [Oscillospiraceae bacterium]|nr:DUF4367 domain-containing protein [Oscillospiraceae bacterium]
MTLKNVLEDICMEEYALPANAPAHRFSRRHRRAINAVLYPDGLPKTKRRLPLKCRVIAVVAIVALAAVTGCAAVIRYGGFEFGKERVGFQTFITVMADDRHKAPKIIEKICYDVHLPEKYWFYSEQMYDDEAWYETIYMGDEFTFSDGSKPWFIVRQMTKNTSFAGIDVEDCEINMIKIKGYDGYTVVQHIEGTEKCINSITWNCEDYTHIIIGTAPLDDILDIAENLIEK